MPIDIERSCMIQKDPKSSWRCTWQQSYLPINLELQQASRYIFLCLNQPFAINTTRVKIYQCSIGNSWVGWKQGALKNFPLTAPEILHFCETLTLFTLFFANHLCSKWFHALDIWWMVIMFETFYIITSTINFKSNLQKCVYVSLPKKWM